MPYFVSLFLFGTRSYRTIAHHSTAAASCQLNGAASVSTVNSYFNYNNDNIAIYWSVYKQLQRQAITLYFKFCNEMVSKQAVFCIVFGLTTTSFESLFIHKARFTDDVDHTPNKQRKFSSETSFRRCFLRVLFAISNYFVSVVTICLTSTMTCFGSVHGSTSNLTANWISLKASIFVVCPGWGLMTSRNSGGILVDAAADFISGIDRCPTSQLENKQ